MSWRSFIDNAPSAEHAVEVYDELDELAESVGRFFAAGFEVGAPALVIATPEHWQRFTEELAARTWDVRELEKRGLVTYRDAERTLVAVMDSELPSAERFEQVVGSLIDEVTAQFPGQTIRAFGEMVGLLWQRCHKRAAIALEELWNELQQSRRFALLCGYQLDVFDLGVQADELPDIFRAHTHSRPAHDSSRFAAALDQAIAETVGPMEAARIYLDVAEQVPRSSLPRAQAVLGWLSASNKPGAARILERTGLHYRRLRQTPTATFAG